MELTLDLKKMCDNMKNAENQKELIIFDTPGEEYVYENIVKKCVRDIPFTISEIDFSAFTEDDIVNIIDDKREKFEAELTSVYSVVEKFHDKPALTSTLKRFF